ncbi:AraC family transcriptional regulator [Butyrivibrio sp. WCD3002]|uniref:AraC family transcriptional regulator n=1 Tax=Butyrivibrio sp. WCD3002 TaxID=1280676 RepID=UPI000426D284|nr:AraC family transcriptional regulator [Butyrivibrio sp. WCD3002]
MIDISGHLREYRREIGFSNYNIPLEVNCCGQQSFLTRDFSKSRPNGRLDYQLIYITRGCGIFNFSGKEQIVNAGGIVLYRPGEPQLYSYSFKDKTSAYWIHFTGSNAEKILNEFHIHSGYIGNSIQIKDIFQEIIKELQLKKTGYSIVATADLEKMLALINRSMELEASEDRNDLVLERLIIQLNQSYNNAWSVTSMAKYCNLSEGYFSHYFKEKMGVSPMKYLANLRIEKAKFLLSESDISVSNIAASLGFSDVLYFSRIFKKAVGESPTAFRNALN